MHMYDILNQKRLGKALTREEIEFFVRGCTNGEIPDYQTAALLMAICIQGMDDRETAELTLAMAHSGEMADLSAIPGRKADKHSTGGVGDKTTLITAPLAAACGVTVAKMSGRGLGHTGGTIDKLESIPGFTTQLSPERFAQIAGEIGVCIVSQSGNLAPADKKLYALRDVTATVESIPLIASSIMSKKLAGGSDCIVLDVKVGSGAFMKTVEDAKKLARAMVSIGSHAGRRTAALITDMDSPLGMTVGNALEVEEACQVLLGQGPEDLTKLSVELAAMMAWLGEKAPDLPSARRLAEEKLANGCAAEKFRQMVKAQGGDPEILEHPERLPKAKYSQNVLSPANGWIAAMNTQGIGRSSVLLGAGRETEESKLSPGAGIRFLKKTGDWVEKGETLAIVYSDDRQSLTEGAERLVKSLTITGKSSEKRPLIYGIITKNNEFVEGSQINCATIL